MREAESSRYFIHARTPPAQRWVCVGIETALKLARERVELCRRIAPVREYLISESLHPLPEDESL